MGKVPCEAALDVSGTRLRSPSEAARTGQGRVLSPPPAHTRVACCLCPQGGGCRDPSPPVPKALT